MPPVTLPAQAEQAPDLHEDGNSTPACSAASRIVKSGGHSISASSPLAIFRTTLKAAPMPPSGRLMPAGAAASRSRKPFAFSFASKRSCSWQPRASKASTCAASARSTKSRNLAVASSGIKDMRASRSSWAKPARTSMGASQSACSAPPSLPAGEAPFSCNQALRAASSSERSGFRTSKMANSPHSCGRRAKCARRLVFELREMPMCWSSPSGEKMA
mmetsp:Transcript_11571/g.24380  ORF Transcript_11571/g.24380 Transcript_11571/m.24380 type:complete len:217 (+) Transcript_11571:191-841(+)